MAPKRVTPIEEAPASTGEEQVECSSKRRREAEKDGKESKRRKTKDSESTVDTKKKLFQRLWSEKDEVALLKGVIAFIGEEGSDAFQDMNAFYEFIKESIHFNVSLIQLKEKVARFKKKFVNHVTNCKKGEGKTFSRAHDQELFDLSKKIWGSEGLCGVKGTNKGVKNQREMGNFDKATMEYYVIKRGLDMVGRSKKPKLEVKWTKLRMEELELYVKQLELICELGKPLLASGKKSPQH